MFIAPCSYYLVLRTVWNYNRMVSWSHLRHWEGGCWCVTASEWLVDNLEAIYRQLVRLFRTDCSGAGWFGWLRQLALGCASELWFVAQQFRSIFQYLLRERKKKLMCFQCPGKEVGSRVRRVKIISNYNLFYLIQQGLNITRVHKYIRLCDTWTMRDK